MVARVLRSPGVRFVGSVALVSGVLLIADAAATLIWQEPISALIAQRAQAQLQLELEHRRPSSAGGTGAPARVRVRVGHALGRIEFPTLRSSYVMVQGTTRAALRKGPGHYPDTPLPGQPGTVAVAGHRTTYLAPFRRLDRLRRGNPVVLAMPYGRFVYRVQHARIVQPSALWVKRAVGYDRLVLTACHPLYSSAQRIVVFARLADPGKEDRSRDSNHSTSPPTSASETISTASQ
jgi:sortase A